MNDLTSYNKKPNLFNYRYVFGGLWLTSINILRIRTQIHSIHVPGGILGSTKLNHRCRAWFSALNPVGART